MIYILDKLINAKENKIPYFHKNLFDNLPTWDHFLNCIFKEIQVQDSIDDLSYGKNVNEKKVGNVVITENIYFSPKINDLNPHFKEFDLEIKKFQNLNKIRLGFSGPKIAIGPRFVDSHKDKWDAFTLQCQGTTIWRITSENKEFDETFYMSPGDFLFFPQELFHSIKCEGPRVML
ncbi:MAG: hypothetical protein EBT24_12635 [Betaproteobacteria bacterium]|nr:hypothetical protein [Betaproteobacteria bacterium]